MILGALINVPAGIGYPLLFGLVAAESAGGLVPGETSLIVAAALAAQGQLSLPIVIAVAAGAAILGDNLGKTRPGSGGILLAHEFHRPERTRHVQRSSRLPGLRRTQRQRRSHDHLITCSLCLRVLRGSEWKDADQVIREIRSYELDALPRLDSAVAMSAPLDLQPQGPGRRGDRSVTVGPYVTGDGGERLCQQEDGHGKRNCERAHRRFEILS